MIITVITKGQQVGQLPQNHQHSSFEIQQQLSHLFLSQINVRPKQPQQQSQTYNPITLPNSQPNQVNHFGYQESAFNVQPQSPSLSDRSHYVQPTAEPAFVGNDLNPVRDFAWNLFQVGS